MSNIQDLLFHLSAFHTILYAPQRVNLSEEKKPKYFSCPMRTQASQTSVQHWNWNWTEVHDQAANETKTNWKALQWEL